MGITIMIRKNSSLGFCLSTLLYSGIINASVDPSSDINIQPYQGTQVSHYLLTWSDEFNGTEVNEKRWNYRLDCKHWSQQRKANNTVSGGLYRIHLRKESVDCPNNNALQPGQQKGQKPAGKVQYTGGGIISKDELRYGYYEAKLKMPSGAGWHTSFWMMRNQFIDSTSKHDLNSNIELDPVENDSIDLKHYQIDAHQWSPTPGTEDPGRKQNKVGTKQVRFKDETRLDDFHIYGLEFTSTHLRYFFDGKLQKETSFDVNQYKHNDISIWFTSIASFLANTKQVDNSHLPAEAQVDYVRFFQTPKQIDELQ